MHNENLIDRIQDEIDRCDGEIRKADDTIIRMQERRLCYDTRKTVLQILLDMTKKEGVNNAE